MSIECGDYEIVDDHPSAAAFSDFEDSLGLTESEPFGVFLARRDAFRAGWDSGFHEARKPIRRTVAAPVSLEDDEPEKPTPGGRDDVP
jgi:hypothetical protein